MNNSSLHDEKTFYKEFLEDLDKCLFEVIIESPFITIERMATFYKAFEKLLKRGVKIYIFTRDPQEHDGDFNGQSEEAIRWCEKVGIQVLLCVGNHHRKLAIFDRKTLWEGSLNILSQAKSREIMRRIDDEGIAMQTFNFLNLSKFL